MPDDIPKVSAVRAGTPETVADSVRIVAATPLLAAATAVVETLPETDEPVTVPVLDDEEPVTADVAAVVDADDDEDAAEDVEDEEVACRLRLACRLSSGWVWAWAAVDRAAKRAARTCNFMMRK